MLILSSFAKKLPERLMFERTYNNDEEDKYSRSKFYYPENLETSNVEKLKPKHRRKSGGHRRFYKQAKNCKHK